MSPEELNRTIEFIIGSQARLAAGQEQDRQDRLEFQEWSKGITGRLAKVADQQSQLLVRGSERLDSQDKFYRDWLRQNQDFQK